MSSPQTTTDLQTVARAIRDHDRFLLTTHENPDGDALGSVLAAKLGLDAIGKDAVMYLFGQTPLPGEYSFMQLEELRRDLPDDAGERVLIALDCANESRLGRDEPPLIELVTDTGRFQYTNTTPKALRLAAELVEAGANFHRIFRVVYESVEFAKLKL